MNDGVVAAVARVCFNNGNIQWLTDNKLTEVWDGQKKKRRNKRSTNHKKTEVFLWIISAAVVVITVLALSGKLPFTGKETGKSFDLTEKETRPVLDPSMFSGQARAAYAAAKKYPEIMNEVFCYCYCNEPPFYHKTLLSCFTEKHGAG